MSESPKIQHEETGPRGRYFMVLDDGSEAELTYRRSDPKTLVADHTGVPPQHRGKGLAELLVDRLIADAEAQELKIVPHCSYVAAQFRRHPEWAALRA